MSKVKRNTVLTNFYFLCWYEYIYNITLAQYFINNHEYNFIDRLFLTNNILCHENYNWSLHLIKKNVTIST